jgi:hypothetical protein
MGAAADRAKELRAQVAAKELRAQVAEANAAAKAEARAERIAESQRQREADIADTEEYRKNEFAVFAGPVHSYLAGYSLSNGGVEFDLVEWKSSQGSVALTREQVVGLIADLQNLIN